MRRQLERYFELFPLIAIILILIAGEHRRQSAPQLVESERSGFEFAAPPVEVEMPRLILR